MDGDGNGFSEERLARIHEIINRRKNGGPVPFERVREVLDDFHYGLAFEAGIDIIDRRWTEGAEQRRELLDSLEKSFKQIERDLQKLDKLDRPISRQIFRNCLRPRRFRSPTTDRSQFSLDWRRAIRFARASRPKWWHRPKREAIDAMLLKCVDAAIEITGDAELTNSNSANSWFIKFCHEVMAAFLKPKVLPTHQALYSRWREMREKGARPRPSGVAEGPD
jgi:hypothetical protein